MQTIIHNSKHTTYLIQLQFEELLLDASIHVKRFSLSMCRKHVNPTEAQWFDNALS